MDQQKRPYIGYYNHNESQKNFKPRLNLSNQNKIGDIRELSILQTKNKKKKSKKAFSRSENAQILKENWEKEKEEAKRNKEHVDIDVPYEEPWFLRDEYIQDENQRKKTDPNYDPTTLYIPKDEWLKFSPAMYQYWEIKTKHFDKILLFKLGKFYELYNEDAIIAHRILDLNWMRASKRLHVGFPEKVLSKNLTKLVEEGFQCVIVEQCENSRMLQKRLEEQKEISHPVDECAKRAVTCIFTKGTFSDPNNQDYHSRYILVFKHDHENNIGIGFFDVGTLQFFLGRYKDNESFGMFRTIINQIRPVEVIFDRENTQEELVNILKNAALSPLFSTVSPKDCWGIPKTLSAIENYFGENHEEWPEILRKAREDDNSDLMMNAFGMIINYLEKLLIAEQTLPLGAFKEFDPKKSMVTTLVMDSQVVQHLEILEVEKTTQRCREGSLIDYLDRTSTLFGKRMLERWICSPLTDTIKINDRLDCIEDLINNYMLMTNFRTKLKTLPDIEKLLGKLYKYSIKQSVKVVYFENLSVNKIKEFHDLLEHLKSLKGIINIWGKFCL